MPVNGRPLCHRVLLRALARRQMLAFTARGNTRAQWWRHGHSHLDESEIWMATLGGTPKYEKLAGGAYKCLWPMWSADSARVYFMSDQGGAENLWEKGLKGGAPKQVTQFRDGRVLWPSISYDGKTIVFERDFSVWKLDTAPARPQKSRSPGAAPPVRRKSATSRSLPSSAIWFCRPTAVNSPSRAHGEVFAAVSREGGAAARVSRTAGNRKPDRMVTGQQAYGVRLRSRRQLPSVSPRFRRRQRDPGDHRLRLGATPLWSPDGKLLAFVRNFKELCVYDVAGKQVRVLSPGRFPRPPFGGNRFYAWSPDNQWIAYFTTGERSFENLFVAPAAGGTHETDQLPRQHQQRHRPLGARWNLPPLRHQSAHREQQHRAHRPGAEDAALPRGPLPRSVPRHSSRHSTRPGCASSRCHPGSRGKSARQARGDRLRWHPQSPQHAATGLDARLQQISPDGKTLLITAATARQQNLYSYSLDELATEPAVARQITARRA